MIYSKRSVLCGKWLGCILLVFLVGIVTSGCYSADGNIRNDRNRPSQGEQGSAAKEPLNDKDDYARVSKSLSESETIILKLIGLNPITETGNNLEMRLWTNMGGMDDSKLLVLSSNKTEHRVEFFDIQRALDPKSFSKQSIDMSESKWESLLEAKKRLTTPNELEREPNFSISRHEPLIILEVLEGGKYRRVFYGQWTTFPDGKRLLEICNSFSSDLGIDLKCMRE